MKVNQEKSIKRDYKMRKNELRIRLFSLISVCFSACILSFSWFLNIKDSSTTDMKFTTEDWFGFKISKDGYNYFNEIKLSFPENLDMIPVSGTGDKLYMVKMPMDVSNPLQDDGSFRSDCKWVLVNYSTDASDTNYFFKTTLYFESSSIGDVVIDEIHVCSPIENFENRQNTDSDQIVRLASGNFVNPVITEAGENYLTRDYICAATRVLFIANNGQKTVIFPNNEYTLTVTDVAGGQKLSLNELDTSLKTENDFYYIEQDGTSGLRTFGEIGYSTFTSRKINDEDALARIAQLTYDSNETSDYVYKASVDVYFWIEGFDPETISYFEGGELKVDIAFKYQEGIVQ